MNQIDNSFDQWGLLELMGHRRIAGRIREVSLAGATMLQIDVPQRDGSFVSQIYGGQAVYGITPMTEESCRGFVTGGDGAMGVWDAKRALERAGYTVERLPAPEQVPAEGDQAEEWDGP